MLIERGWKRSRGNSFSRSGSFDPNHSLRILPSSREGAQSAYRLNTIAQFPAWCSRSIRALQQQGHRPNSSPRPRLDYLQSSAGCSLELALSGGEVDGKDPVLRFIRSDGSTSPPQTASNRQTAVQIEHSGAQGSGVLVMFDGGTRSCRPLQELRRTISS